MEKNAPITWSIDSAQGHIQGPLELASFEGQHLSLTLQPQQIALLIAAGELQAIYRDGHHLIEIGNGDEQIDPVCSLIFIALDKPLKLHWTRAQPLSLGTAAHQQMMGRCDLRIDQPLRFFETFLQSTAAPDPGFVTRLIDQLVRGLFEDLLGNKDTGEVQARLTRLTPGDLNDDLIACGLHCTAIAVYTLALPVEDDVTTEASPDPVVC